MPLQRVHDRLAGPLTQDYLAEKAAAGWTPVAVVWERGSGEPPAVATGITEEVPFGYRVAADCEHLERNPQEQEVLAVIAEVIVGDRPFSQIPVELNQRGLRTRAGAAWDRISVFNLLPQLIESAPRIFASDQWPARRQRAAQPAP